MTVVGARQPAYLEEGKAVEESASTAEPASPDETAGRQQGAVPGGPLPGGPLPGGPLPDGPLSEEIDLRLAGLVVELTDRTRQAVRQVGEEEGLSVAQLDVLRRLRAGASPMRRLAVQMNCEASNLTGLVDRLEARGLVERQPHPDDRRVKCVGLTAAGEQLGRDVWLEVAGRCELNRLSESRKRAVAAALWDAMRSDG